MCVGLHVLFVSRSVCAYQTASTVDLDTSRVVPAELYILHSTGRALYDNPKPTENEENDCVMCRYECSDLYFQFIVRTSRTVV